MSNTVCSVSKMQSQDTLKHFEILVSHLLSKNSVKSIFLLDKFTVWNDIMEYFQVEIEFSKFLNWKMQNHHTKKYFVKVCK